MPVSRCVFNVAVALSWGATLTCGVLAAEPCDRVRTGRVALIGGTYAATQAALLALRAGDWWQTPRTAFHFAARPSPSKGQDRLLHAAIGYQTSQVGFLAFRWACVPANTAAWLGAALGVAMSLPKEIGDGFHEQQGFDLPDMAWTAAGSVLPALHRTVPPTRALVAKGFYWPSAEYRRRRGPLPQLENDYAGQRYYLAIQPGRLPGGGGPWPD